MNSVQGLHSAPASDYEETALHAMVLADMPTVQSNQAQWTKRMLQGDEACQRGGRPHQTLDTT
eukprot:1408091-Amphidinium_carterae.1